MKIKDEKAKKELPIIEKCFAHVEGEKPLRSLELSDDELKVLSGYQLLSMKPLLIGVNFDFPTTVFKSESCATNFCANNG